MSVAAAESIANAAAARRQDERAMLRYLGIGRRPAKRPDELPSAAARLIIPDQTGLADFDAPEQQRLQRLIAALSVEQRRELIALAWFGRSASLSFEAALRRARRIPPEGQLGYLMGRQLERHIPAALDKLRCG